MKQKLFSIALLVTISTPALAAAAELDALVETCNGCHGEQGVSRWDDMPTIAGIDAFVHADALWVYKENGRPCMSGPFKQGDTNRPETSMCDIAAALNEGQIEALAEHYAALPFVPAKQDFDVALADKGSAIHDSECKRCHSDGGSNPEDEASILAGQWMGYLRSTFAEYAAGDREQPEKMREKMDALSDADKEALIHYYASQQ